MSNIWKLIRELLIMLTADVVARNGRVILLFRCLSTTARGQLEGSNALTLFPIKQIDLLPLSPKYLGLNHSHRELN